MTPKNNRPETRQLNHPLWVTIRSSAAIVGAVAAAFEVRQVSLAIAVAIAIGEVIAVLRHKRAG
ncbi:hypothetical protein [Micromonospora sp. NPDC006431]|uniref:hypothetical protein n=1 Tax=Micromonospora sp. NPDC006431 TaxID=3364235 RepID=UPI003683C8F3